jgi:hypothetical protein
MLYEKQRYDAVAGKMRPSVECMKDRIPVNTSSACVSRYVPRYVGMKKTWDAITIFGT